MPIKMKIELNKARHPWAVGLTRNEVHIYGLPKLTPDWRSDRLSVEQRLRKISNEYKEYRLFMQRKCLLPPIPTLKII